MKNKKIAVAMSGGIDSLVTAFLLKQKKADITGVHFFTGYEGKKRSVLKQEIEKMAESLDIPMLYFNIHHQFEEMVVKYFTESYKKGLTPNPCLVCNPLIKFSLLLEKLQRFGIEKIATGHYVRTKTDANGKLHLLKGRDEKKDQSYFLSMVPEASLKNAVFPLGNLSKKNVRRIAANFNLIPCEKEESQDICFIKNRSYSDFLEKTKKISLPPGTIERRDGKIIGKHKGLHNFTIGQRKGINCPGPYPYYVLELNTEKNTLIVGSKEELFSSSCILSHMNWLQKPESEKFHAKVKIRYSHPEKEALVTCLNKNKVRVDFDEKISSITPGQGGAIYINDEIIGAGFITNEEI